jgi:4-amino-4-deoxy-L-arabinose transferase-like glycosyltransferase
VIVWWVWTLLIKIAIVSLSPLTWDENYYWVWSQNLQLSYYDHPAMVAWLFALGNFLPTFMLKWPAILMGHAFLLIWDHFLKNINFSMNQRKAFFGLALLSPLVGLSTLVLTPDLPLLFFLGLSVYAFERALTTKYLQWYALFGLFLGLGFTSKYMIVLMLPGFFFYLFAHKKWSRISKVGILLTLVCFFLGASPVLIWNLKNDWISFKFQLDHGVGARKYKNIWPLEFVLSQLLIITPFFITDFFRKTSASSSAPAPLDNENRTTIFPNQNGQTSFEVSWPSFFLYVVSPIFVFFFLNSFKNKVEANWTQVAFPFLLSYLASKDLRPIKLKLYSAFWLSLLVILLSQLQMNWWKRPSVERLTEPFRYAALVSEIDRFQPFYATSYQMASYLWFQTGRPVYKIYQTSRVDFFDYFPQAKPGESVFYVAKNKDTDFPNWFLQLGYKISVAKEIDSNLEILRVSK